MSGVLELTRSGARRVLHLLEGQPVAFASTVPGDGLASLLVQAAGVPAERAREWVATEAPGVDVLDARVASGDLTEEAAQATWRAWLSHGVCAPLEWATGTWVFRREAGLRPGCVDPTLLPGVTALGVLRGSLDRLVPGPLALAEAQERAAPLHPGPRHEQLAGELDVPPALADAIARGAMLAPLVAPGRPDAQALARLVWLLVRLRVVSSGGGPVPADLLVRLLDAGKGEPPALPPRPAPSRPASVAPQKPRRARRKRKPRASATPRTAPAPRTDAPPLNAVVTMLRVDHDARLGRDHYRFLGVREDENRDRIQQAIARLGERWRDALADPRIDERSRTTAEHLLAQLAQVERDLGDASKQAEYDARIGLVRSPFALDASADDPLLATMEFEVEEAR